MSQTLHGRRALITGSTSGLGLGIAQALAAAGCDIMLNGFGDPTSALADLRSHNITAHHHPADLTDPTQCRALIADTHSALGGLDILVNNAGIQRVHPLESFPTEDWDAILALNLTAAFHTTAAALPAMRAQGWGRILNVASVHGLVASIHKAAYVAAKHGLIGLTKVTALETATSGITCNALCPGFVDTPLIQQQIDALATRNATTREQAQRDLLAEKEPTLRFTAVEDLGALVVFLCSNSAANMTGSAIPIDGAWTAQ